VHDIHCVPPSADMERALLKYDRVLCLSNWHKDYFCSVYPTLHPDRVVVTRNGIDPARFANVVPKTNSLVFSSSPNRGLDWLIANFIGGIKPVIPDAELHIFYGFDTWETMARARGAQDEIEAIEKFKAILPPLGGNAGGIFNHGKRPQHEVAAAYMRAKVWPYLTAFPETSCITAMEAQAAGCVPVCSKFAALAETVKHGIFVDNTAPNVAGEWVGHVTRLLRNDVERIGIADKAREYALGNLSWAALAKDWAQMFAALIAETAASPIPMWRSA
jgi:glycosyltransferase involved in cell wall biosynthesis